MKLTLKVVPNASRNEIIGWYGEALKVKVQAPPEDGKANKQVVALLAKQWGIGRRELRIVSGEKSRDKVVEVDADVSAHLPKQE